MNEAVTTPLPHRRSERVTVSARKVSVKTVSCVVNPTVERRAEPALLNEIPKIKLGK